MSHIHVVHCMCSVVKELVSFQGAWSINGIVCEQRHAQAIADERDEIDLWKQQLLTVVAKYIVKRIQELVIKYIEEKISL